MRKIISLVLAMALLISFMCIPTFAAETITLDEFIARVEAGNGVYDGNNEVVVEFTNDPAAANFYKESAVNNTYIGQYYGLFGKRNAWQGNAFDDISVSNVTFVFTPDPAQKITTAEFVIWSKGNIFFGNCTFNGVSVDCAGEPSPATNVESATFVDCTFMNIIKRNGIHQADAKKLVISGCTFENSDKAIHFNCSALESVVIENNNFYNVGNGVDSLITVGENNVATATISIADNTVSYDDGVVKATGVINLGYNPNFTNSYITSSMTNNDFDSLSTFKPKGVMNQAYVNSTSIWGETGKHNAENSYVIVIKSGDEKLGQIELVATEYLPYGNGLTWTMFTDGSSYPEWAVTWEDGALNADKVPTTAELWIDGVKVDENKVYTNGPDNLNPSHIKWSDVENVFSAASVNGEKFGSLNTAYKYAADGDEIILLSDLNDVDLTIDKDITLNLNGYTLNDAYIKTKGNVEIKNGDIKNVAASYPLVVENGTLTVNDLDIEASKSDRAIWVRGGNLVFNSGSILATKGAGNTTSMNITAIYTSKNTNVTINGGNITVDTPNNKAIAIYGNYENANVTINGGKISTNGANYSYGINVDGDITVNGGEIVTNEKGYGYSSGISYGYNYALNSALGNITITGGKITTNGHTGYIANVGRSYNSNDQVITISGGEFSNNLSEIDKTTGGHKAPALIKENSSSNVTATITDGKVEGFSEKFVNGDSVSLAISGGSYDADPSAYVVPGLAAAVGSNGKFAIIPDSELPETLEVKFVKTENKGVYDIVVEGDAFVNELSTVALTFVNESENNDGTAMGYSITGVAPYNYLVEGDKYTFYATSGAAMTDDTLFVKVGQVKFAGYGEIDFEVLATADNRAIIKTAKDNAEYIYAKLGTLDAVGNLVIDTDAAINEEIAPEMADLTIEVDYVHDVKNNDFDYQQMTIEITGLDLLGEVITFNLGDDGVYDACTNVASESNVAHSKHTVVVSDKLIEGNSYTVKVYGDGYRTAEYTIRMENDKTLKFWNNVMTNKTYMEEDDLEGTQVNFLAGDILPDEIINVYDLSAVVSYFGENPKANAGYIQYDLNRDGKIDGLDISILLNSWGK